TWSEHQKVLEAHEPFRELLLRRPGPDGQPRFVEVSGAPMFDERRNFTGYRGVAKDVTDRERVQVELRKAKDAAETANQAKSRFVAGMSQEIRAPMQNMLGMMKSLRATQLDETQQRFVEGAQANAETLRDAMSDFLDIARIEVGTLELEHHDFKLRDLIDDVV